MLGAYALGPYTAIFYLRTCDGSPLIRMPCGERQKDATFEALRAKLTTRHTELEKHV